MTLARFVIKGETPAKKNSKRVFARGSKVIVIPSERYEEWHSNAVGQVITQNVDKISAINEPVKLDVSFYHADKRRRDSDNGLSSILDLLVDTNILADDNYNIVQKINVQNFQTDKENGAFCVVEILKI